MRTTAPGTPAHALPHSNILADYPLDTSQFAERQGIRPQSLRVRLSETGSYFGVRPLRLANRLLRPLLDAMQTMPTFVYMIPAVMLLGPGKVPAVLATVVYAVVPVIRLTSHGIQQVDPNVVEASAAFGASRWQTLFKVQIPQAMPTIMTGINQTMMMAVAMVVTCAMIGANGLGMEVLIAINRTESGRGLIAGISIVIIAIIIDRLTQSLADKKKEGK